MRFDFLVSWYGEPWATFKREYSARRYVNLCVEAGFDREGFTLTLPEEGSMKKKMIRIRETTYTLTAAEIKNLKKQLDDPSKFVALGMSGQVVAEGNKVVSLDHSADGVKMAFENDPENTWWFFGDDHYTIVTREQYEALVEAGLAQEKDE